MSGNELLNKSMSMHECEYKSESRVTVQASVPKSEYEHYTQQKYAHSL